MSDIHAVNCPDCGHFEEVLEGAYGSDVGERAHKIKAGHMSGNGCKNTQVYQKRDCGKYHPLPCGLDKDCNDG